MKMPSLKSMMQNLANSLPEDCDWRQLYYHLYVARRIDDSLRDEDFSKTYTTEEVRERLKAHSRDLKEHPEKRHTFVQSREQLIAYLFHIQDDFLDSDDQSSFRESTVDYLEALKAWLDTCEGHYQAIGSPTKVDEPSWQLFADALRGAARFP